ncbi:baseplate protein [Paenibacillus montaniterrae]|uniref:Baseplate protein n=2 Tax=Paenibacillus montaniterrae TaxID=429341 RepID=A0A919YQ36_9BACL|nr:baseplate protein [Paenibacillus montaniterrae]
MKGGQSMSKDFMGRGWKFPIEVDPLTGKIRTVEYEDDIAEAISIIIWTVKGERIMHPDFGSGIERYIFENNDALTLQFIKNEVLSAIIQWEPRVHEVEVEVKSDPQMDNKLNIHVQYTVRTTNNLYNQVYPFYLYEGAAN